MSVADHQRHRAAAFESRYPLSIGVSYRVVAMLILENSLRFLVRDDNRRPLMAPAGFFEAKTVSIPDTWQFAVKPGINASGRDLWTIPTVAVWGYDEFGRNDAHLEELEDLDPAALRLFDKQCDPDTI